MPTAVLKLSVEEARARWGGWGEGSAGLDPGATERRQELERAESARRERAPRESAERARRESAPRESAERSPRDISEISSRDIDTRVFTL